MRCGAGGVGDDSREADASGQPHAFQERLWVAEPAARLAGATSRAILCQCEGATAFSVPSGGV